MNTFAWNITFSWNIKIKFRNPTFRFVKNLTKDGDTNLFFYWETDLVSSDQVLEYFKENLSKNIISYDISISSEDKIEIYKDEELDGEYWILTLSWISNDFEDVVETFKNDPPVVCIREAENSKSFWNRVVKVDVIN